MEMGVMWGSVGGGEGEGLGVGVCVSCGDMGVQVCEMVRAGGGVRRLCWSQSSP